MAGYQGVPTIRKRLIGSQLRRLREDRGYSVEEVADKMSVGPSSLRRQEYGQTAVSVADVKAYAEIYAIDDEALLARLLELAKHARTRGWWSSYDTTVGPTAADVADAEDLATGIRTWQPLTIPGLLQTREYSAAVIDVRRGLGSAQTSLPPDVLLAMRERRKEILARPTPPEIWAVIGEAAILTRVGGAPVMNGQLQHLLNLGERPNISIQILPFSAGAHAGMGGAFVTMMFDGTQDGGIVYMENTGADAFSDEPIQVRERSDRFAHLQAQALPIANTRRYLLKAISTG
jgi:transcriptional regulator with XRE-family HTH domain